jgi:predicted amidophosphoribosyltransferase
MHLKYLHYFGNESSESILEEYGITPKEKQQTGALKPKQCPNCDEPNRPDSKFCAKCRMTLTYDAYSETIEEQKKNEDKLALMEVRVDVMQDMMEKLVINLSKTKDQKEINMVAQSMFSSGVLKQVKVISQSLDKTGSSAQL